MEFNIQVYNINDESVNPFQPVYFSKSSGKVKKISGSILGKVKKIEAQAKLWFSYKKRVLVLMEISCFIELNCIYSSIGALALIWNASSFIPHI